jgi:hypothetical protein
MNAQDLERVLLGTLMMQPHFFEAVELTESLFSTPQLKKIFKLESEIWEIERPTEIDCHILASRLGGNGAAAFVSSLLPGLQRISLESFQSQLGELKRIRIRARLLREVRREFEQEERTGTENPEAIAKILADVQKLGQLEIGGGPEPQPILGNLGDIQPEPVSWIWEPYFPLSKLIGLGGDPDSGKSWFALQIAACLSRGLPWPDGSKNGIVGSTVYLSGEDDPADTLRPRIDSLGGDANKIHFLKRESLDLMHEETIKKLENEIIKIGDVRLLVLDPAFDFSGRTNPNAVEQSRAFLNPIQALARRLAISVLLIIHARKGEVEKAIDWIGGSKSGWAGKFRALFGIELTEDDSSRRIFFKIKANLAPIEPPKIAFRIVQGRLEFEAKPPDVDVKSLLRPDRSGDGLQITEAVKFLRAVLADGPLDPEDVIKQATQAGICSQRTLERAKARAGVVSYKDGFRWRWRLKAVGGLHPEKGDIAGRCV